MIVPSSLRVAKLVDAEDKAELIGFTLAVLTTADISGERPVMGSLVFVAEMAVIDSSLPSKAISLFITFTVTASP